MPAEKLQQFLDEHGVQYEEIQHAPAYTAQETAEAAHIKGKEMAKTVIVRIDGDLAMAVMPAHYRLHPERLKQVAGAQNVEIVREQEFKDLFPDCEPGAMPPFGNLYGMNVFVQQKLAEDETIAFNAGSHTLVFQTPFRALSDNVPLIESDFSAPEH